MSKLIVDCATGESLERELNKAEKDQQKLDEAKFKEALTILEAETKAKETAKAAILDRIGLTADELQTILG
jgi:hypothetical protein